MSGLDDPETYRTILESLQTGICVVDLRRKLLLWSDGAEQITGYLRHEVVGHECVDNMLPHCNQAGCELCGEHCPLNAATREFKPMESLGFLHHKSGQLIVQYTAKNNDDEDGKASPTSEGKAGEKSSTPPADTPAKKE